MALSGDRYLSRLLYPKPACVLSSAGDLFCGDIDGVPLGQRGVLPGTTQIERRRDAGDQKRPTWTYELGLAGETTYTRTSKYACIIKSLMIQ